MMTMEQLIAQAVQAAQQPLLAAMEQLRAELQNPAPQPVEPYLTIDQVMAAVNYSRTKVAEWIEVGKKAPDGRLVKLPHYRFGDQVRVKLSDLEAFGKIHTKVGQPAKPHKAAPPVRKSVSNRPEEPRMRVA